MHSKVDYDVCDAVCLRIKQFGRDPAQETTFYHCVGPCLIHRRTASYTDQKTRHLLIDQYVNDI
ncbi:hypothetical protein PRIPAC_95402 [Pristionchus pacificus]|uniref:Uncharacterized protein n=1 Tax=Pristionchus pacificus TaxID=54126 RepID=A0A2A6D387_PRIPA|nr:hypothetical protein PRIPAC_95402 [Pristionchus pacificus]|eukprot:PDM84751.1 hypothetical protein PRIPAC_33774 [Pristionchus pacificus]